MGSQGLEHLLTLSVSWNSSFAIAGGTRIVGDKILGSMMAQLVVLSRVDLLVLFVEELRVVLVVVFVFTVLEAVYV